MTPIEKRDFVDGKGKLICELHLYDNDEQWFAEYHFTDLERPMRGHWRINNPAKNGCVTKQAYLEQCKADLREIVGGGFFR